MSDTDYGVQSQNHMISKKHLMVFPISAIQVEYNDLHMLLFLRHFLLWTNELKLFKLCNLYDMISNFHL